MISREGIERARKNKESEKAAFEKKLSELRRQDLEKQGLKLIENPSSQQDNFHGDCDHPNTMENGPAIVLYIFVMIGGAIFVDRLIIWIIATIIFCNFIMRHKT